MSKVFLSKEQVQSLHQEIEKRWHYAYSGSVTIEDSYGSNNANYHFSTPLPRGHVVAYFSYNERPGWSAIEINREGEIVHEWTGGLD